MKLVIYTSKGVARTEITPSEQSTHHKELMQSDYISLQFNAPLINFAVGDYIIVNGAKYVLLDVDKPTSNKSQYYAYTLRFDADWQLLGKRVFFYNRQSGSESKWSITAKASTFMQLVVDNANSVGIGTFTAEVDSKLTNLQFIEFDGTSILDALTMIAEAYECDWWIESNVIHLGTCKIGTAVPLRVGEALTSINRTEASNDIVTRLYAFGSTRNLPTNYRKDTSTAIVDGVVQQRLRLPKGTDYIDVRPNLADNEIIEGVRIFENVYPRTNGAISSVTTKQYTTTTENSDGTTTVEKWNAYRFTDNAIKFSRDYQLDGQDLQVQFQSGSLAGMTFVVEFNPDGEDEASSKSQVWEIIRNDNYGINLPNDTIKPKVGDTYVLTGWDSTKISSLGLIDAAEQELLTEANKWLQKNGNGVYNYECESNSIWCSGYRRVNGEFVFAASNIIDLELGQSVALYDELLIGSSGFNSRVRAYEKNLINPYVCRYTIGETNNYSKTDSLQQQVDAINRSTDPTLPTFGQGGGGNIRLIKRYDSTPESDSLAYSSLRTKHEYLNKTTEDTAEKKITFASGLIVNGDGVVATKVVAPEGEIKQLTADKITTDHIESADYLGDTSGFKLANVAGDSYLEVDKLSVRKKAIFTELDIKRLDHIGGATVTSPASCRIDKVLSYAGGYKCYFRAEDGERTINNDWKIGDQAMCHAYNTTTPRYYWRLVIAVSTAIEDGYHWVALSSSDCDADSDAPMVEDVIACFGNRTDTDRQQVIITNSEGVNSPYIQQLKGINSYNITDANVVTQLSPSKNIIRGEQIELSTASGNKGVQDLANDALGSAKEYADGVLNDAKGYADGVGSSALSNAKTYADGVGSSTLNNAKTYADGVGDDAEANAKKYADGVGTSVTTSVKGYADGLFADSKNYTQEREEYLQSQITANANGIGLCATKTELKTVSDGVDTLATRVTEAEASIKVNADGITALANKTEVDITALGNRISSAEASIEVNAGNIALKANKTDLETVKNSVNGLTTRMTSAETKITQNANAINLKASKDDLTAVSNAVGGLETRMTAAESSLTVQADKISSVVSKQEAMVVDYTFADFAIGEMTWVDTSEGVVIGYTDNVSYHWLRIKNVKKGDVIRFETSDYIGALTYSIVGSDGNADGAEAALIRDQNPIVDQYTWLGKELFEINHDNEEISETLIPMDCGEVYVYTSDDWGNKNKTKVSHIKAKMTAQSRIDQSADNIRLQVGEAGINLDSKVITLDASKTIVTGDLAVRTVKTYWDAAQTQLKSAYNGNGEGTIVYYYPNGRVMKEDTFVSDTSGNIVGMRTTYYKADGSVAWTINEGGFMTTLPDYWTVLNNGNDLRYTTDVDTMMEMLKQYLTDAMKHFSAAKFSRFVSQSGNYKNYNGKVSKAVRSSEAPTDAMLWAGVLVYSVELYKDGIRPTYIVTYEVCTTKLGQVGAIVTKKFNSLGEVS